MTRKKSPKVDLENKRSYFLQIGFILTLAAVIALFGISQKERIARIQQPDGPLTPPEMTDITIQNDKRPPAPFKTKAVTISDILKLVEDSVVITDTTLINMDPTVTAVDADKFGGAGGEEALDPDPVVFAEKMPSFQGGDVNTFRAWVGKTVKYPPAAADNGTQGTITVRFVVERDGSVSRAEIYGRRGNQHLEQEALRVINSSPKWSPGLNNGKPVRVYIVMPVVFVLE